MTIFFQWRALALIIAIVILFYTHALAVLYGECRILKNEAKANLSVRMMMGGWLIAALLIGITL